MGGASFHQPACARSGCGRPQHEHGLCEPCLTRARKIRVAPDRLRMFPLSPAERTPAPRFDWDALEAQAAEQGVGLITLLTRPAH